MRLIKMMLPVLFFIGVILGCVSLDSSEEKAPPITKEMPLNEAISIAVKFGKRSLQDVKKRIRAEKEWKKAEPLIFKLIINHSPSWPTRALVNAVELYKTREPKKASIVFERLVRGEKIVFRQLAWRLAATFPSKSMVQEMESYFTEILSEDELSKAFLTDMAIAVSINNYTEAYTIVREAFYEIGDVDFAQTMAQMDPKQAGEDFIEYLQRAPIEELRQLNLESVNIYTCTLILQHYTRHAPTVSKELIETLFLYSISRNNGLAEMAQDVVEAYVPKHGRFVALVLARMPTWIQIAFIDRGNRKLTPVMARLLDELKVTTPSRDVIEEIRSVRR